MIAVKDLAYIDGTLAGIGSPPFTTWPARRGLNYIYSRVIEAKDEKEREEFDQTLNRTMVEWYEDEQERIASEKQRRVGLVSQIGEVG